MKTSLTKMDATMKRLYDANYPKFSMYRIVQKFISSCDVDEREAYACFHRIHSPKKSFKLRARIVSGFTSQYRSAKRESGIF